MINEKIMNRLKELDEKEYKEELKQFIDLEIITIEEYEYILDELKKNEMQKYLSMHPYSIYYGSNGYWTTYLPCPGKKNNRKKICKKTKEEIINIVVDYWKNRSDVDNNLTIGELFIKWNNKRLSNEYIVKSSYDRYMDVYKRHYKKIKDIMIRETNIEFFIDFIIKEKINNQLEKKAYDLLKNSVKGVIAIANEINKLPFNYQDFNNKLDIVNQNTKFYKNHKKDEDQIFTKEEYKKLVTYFCKNLDSKNMALLFMAIAGPRPGEVVALTHDCIMDSDDIQGKYILICRSETRQRKEDNKGFNYVVQEHTKTDNGYRKVILPESYDFLFDKLKELNPNNKWVFSNNNGSRCTEPSLSSRLKCVCKKLGIKPKSPYAFRKTYASILFDAGLDNKFINSQTGWGDNTTVGECNYHKNRRSLKEKRKRINEIEELKNVINN